MGGQRTTASRELQSLEFCIEIAPRRQKKVRVNSPAPAPKSPAPESPAPESLAPKSKPPTTPSPSKTTRSNPRDRYLYGIIHLNDLRKEILEKCVCKKCAFDAYDKVHSDFILYTKEKRAEVVKRSRGC